MPVNWLGYWPDTGETWKVKPNRADKRKAARQARRRG